MRSWPRRDVDERDRRPLATAADAPEPYTPEVAPASDESQADLAAIPPAPGLTVALFAVEPSGAGFALVDRQRFLWDILAADCDFGPDGALWVSDWVEGWNRTGKRRIVRAFDPVLVDDPLVRETAALLREGLAGRPVASSSALLGHADQRVRQATQFALVEAGYRIAKQQEPAFPVSVSRAP